MGKRKIMFLCTGNSCRSQMAEGWARALGGDLWEVHSAGLEAHGVNPRAVAVMAEVGVDISGQTSKTIDPALLERMDLVITLCGHADAHCPVTPPHIARWHWPFDDPARAPGDEAAVMAEFRRVRDEICARVAAFAAACRAKAADAPTDGPRPPGAAPWTGSPPAPPRAGERPDGGRGDDPAPSGTGAGGFTAGTAGKGRGG